MTHDRVAEDARVARDALARYDFGPTVALDLINLSENATFMIGVDGLNVAVLRVHRQGYHSKAQIDSELAWLQALASHGGILVASPRANAEGELVTAVSTGDGERYAVVFELIEGSQPDAGTLSTADFELLGAITARLHDQSQTWERPAGFRRFSWDWRHSLGEDARWGRWEQGIAVGDDERTLFGRAADLIRLRLADYGQGADRFGLIHADLRLANLVRGAEGVTVIDFDDCGLSWLMYDFGAAVSFIEHDPRLNSWQTAWLAGYRSVRELGEEHERMLATFVMLRRLLLIAWMGTHSHAREVRQLGPAYTAATRELARTYLSSGGDLVHER